VVPILKPLLLGGCEMKKYLSALAFAPVSAFAAVPAAVTTAISDATTDSATVAGAVLVLIIGIAVFLWMRRAAK